MFRFVADRQEPTFETIEELLREKSIKFSMLAGKSPVLERVKKELTKYWEEEANKGRSIEEYARLEMILKSLFNGVAMICGTHCSTLLL